MSIKQILTSETRQQIFQAVESVNQQLLSRRNGQGWWTGQLSTSALSTATAIMALLKALEATDGSAGLDIGGRREAWGKLAAGGLNWLANHQNADGGWGDTVLSISNISTTMLGHAVFRAAYARHSSKQQQPSTNGVKANEPVVTNESERDLKSSLPMSLLQTDTTWPQRWTEAMAASGKAVEEAGGVAAVVRRYGKDRTFSVPILTHCALAGIVDWKDVIPLPFELSCVPHRWYAAVKMPVVSYALPALIAIGQVIFKHQGHWNPILRFIRRKSISPSLRVLESIQPPNGGFLEATPLTSFVCMSLIGCGLFDHVVAQRCLNFIEASARTDGSWPIDTNLSTWVTTLSVNALSKDSRGMSNATSSINPATRNHAATQNHAADLNSADLDTPAGSKSGLKVCVVRDWLLGQQYREIHPYTHAAPGGWSWTDLPGGVPDADDTPSAMLALMNLRTAETLTAVHGAAEAGAAHAGVENNDLTGAEFSRPEAAWSSVELSSLRAAAVWLLDLQNRDGGWPTFCRGWGTLPFDRSSCDLTAHSLRALHKWLRIVPEIEPDLRSRAKASMNKGIRFLKNVQRADGTWLPLWFGHQFNEDDENPLYGTSRVVRALATIEQESSDCCRKAVRWLLDNQNDDGGWSARRGLMSSVEETGLALDSLTDFADDPSFPEVRRAVDRAAEWLAVRVNEGTVEQPTPIGFYFARLWYFEDLYPIIFAAAGLNRWRGCSFPERADIRQ